MKKTLVPIILAALASNIFSETFFSGETGLASHFSNTKVYGIEPSLFMNGFFAGQLSLTNALSVRGEIAFQTSDMYENGVFDEADSSFRINELSASYVKSLLGATHTVSVFRGFYESIGSQHYIQRQLGTENFSSPLTENYIGLNGGYVYDVYGFGGQYSITLRTIPLSAGIVVSKINETSEDVPQINGDLRLAVAFRYLTLDFLGGVGAPLRTKNDKGEDVVLLIDTLYYHMGAEILLGNRYSPLALFGQCGFEYLPVKSSKNAKDFEKKDMYLLVEPRLKLGNLKLYLTAFNIPKEKVSKMLFIDNSLGANASLFYDGFETKKRAYTLGINGMVSFEGKYFTDYNDEDFKDAMNIKISPFAEIEAMKGKLKLLLQTNITKIKDEKPDAVQLHIGYKKEL